MLVIGGGPGGYHAAFRAASHGISTAMVESMPADFGRYYIEAKAFGFFNHDRTPLPEHIDPNSPGWPGSIVG